MLLLLDLDGTLVNTVHPSWKPYKDGQQDCPVDQIPLFPGVQNFIATRKAKGDSLFIVSDSHPRYVNPIAEMLGLEAISLADKPNVKKLNDWFDAKPQYRKEIQEGNCCVIGDTKLDIELGRRLCALTIWILSYQISTAIKDNRDGIGDDMASKKMGPTFAVNSFVEIGKILDSITNHLYSIEAAFEHVQSLNSVRFSENRFADGSYAFIRCLARQEQGACDKYARADKYFQISNANRTQEFLSYLVAGISSYLNQSVVIGQGWDYFTYLTDKASTVPANKMKEIFDLVNTSIPKLELLKWSDSTKGSLRDRNLYKERKDFLEQNLSVLLPKEYETDLFGIVSEQTISIKGKNIVVLDDQLTTGATAWYVIRKLKEQGAKNILFIAMFQMILPVNNEDVLCPKCGKPMQMKIRRKDGHRFYSCTPPEYKGDGCGFIIDINDNLIHFRYMQICHDYPESVSAFLIGREDLPNIEKMVVESIDYIKLIDKHQVYLRWCNLFIDEKMLAYLLEMEIKGKIIYDNEKRNKWYQEFTYLYSDYYDHELSCLEYALENIEKLDDFIENGIRTE